MASRVSEGAWILVIVIVIYALSGWAGVTIGQWAFAYNTKPTLVEVVMSQWTWVAELIGRIY